ncbi:stage II sporulation protein R [Cohnella sp. GCM10027633]|uniref:stage II sporulation protein R n=1 Tax=unclassified Cohnella TaxID=2636738 RepID=UPI0036457E9D
MLLTLTVALAALLVRYAAANAAAGIPEDAIRIRIIANSDSEFDQRVKQDIKTSVSNAIVAWGEMPASHDEAQAFISDHLKQLQKLVSAKLREHEVEYGGKVELAEVPFPAKEFDGAEYPAGEYEALRITLGGGDGANWWCVLFPPMCLTAATAQDDDAKAKPASLSTGGASAVSGGESGEDQPEPKFFLWVIIEKIIAFFAALFS